MKYILALFTLLICEISFAQTIDDAIRYSSFDALGTARTIGIGGAVGALGADFASLSTNPGGLGNYRKSEFVITPFYNFNQSSANVNGGMNTNSNRGKFGFQNVGFVFSKTPNRGKIKTFNVGIGFNQRVNFNRNFKYEGRTEGSIADRWLELAYDGSNAILPDDLDGFEAGIAFEAGAIYDPNSNDGMIEYVNDFFGAPQVLKEQEVDEKGSVNELLLSMGGNYNNKVSYGVTIALPIVNYTRQKIYVEEDDGEGRDGDIPGFNDLRFVENLTTSGVGLTIKAGVAIRISQAFRVGLAAHSPTRIGLNESFNNLLTFSFNDGNGIPVVPNGPTASPNGSFEYRLSTPWRVLGSAAYIIKKNGFVTAEIEFVDYTKNSFDLSINDSSPATQAYQDLLNNDVSTLFSQALNIRLGGEIVVNKTQFRAGFGLLGNPIIGESSFNNTISLGFGYRPSDFFLDLAYRLFLNSTDYRPYNLVNDEFEPMVEANSNAHQLICTFGFRF